jgi:hypothetical protein
MVEAVVSGHKTKGATWMHGSVAPTSETDNGAVRKS